MTDLTADEQRNIGTFIYFLILSLGRVKKKQKSKSRLGKINFAQMKGMKVNSNARRVLLIEKLIRQSSSYFQSKRINFVSWIHKRAFCLPVDFVDIVAQIYSRIVFFLLMVFANIAVHAAVVCCVQRLRHLIQLRSLVAVGCGWLASGRLSIADAGMQIREGHFFISGDALSWVVLKINTIIYTTGDATQKPLKCCSLTANVQRIYFECRNVASLNTDFFLRKIKANEICSFPKQWQPIDNPQFSSSLPVRCLIDSAEKCRTKWDEAKQQWFILRHLHTGVVSSPLRL
ncbi:hypothetical protein T12_4608 [Trichinella patagoniensis]|uniref:Uncharacterized protein n=1 Tax=Trichinella patagoniensis TaxID=990121 RepID=A0A0V0ZIV1_9BILA|nr:hypothetical protein T12_4608 [Trichinella patagoniensis]